MVNMVGLKTITSKEKITKEDLKRIDRFIEYMGYDLRWYQKLYILPYLNKLSYWFFAMKDEYETYKAGCQHMFEED